MAHREQSDDSDSEHAGAASNDAQSASSSPLPKICHGLRRSAFKATQRLSGVQSADLTSKVEDLLLDIGRRVDSRDVHLFRIQLDAATPDPWVIAAFHHQIRIAGNLLARLVDPFLADKNQPRHNHRLGPAAAFGLPAFHNQLVNSDT